MSTTVELSGHNGARLSIGILGYERPAAERGEDANWLVCSVSFRIGPFSGALETSLLRQELAVFSEELARACEDVRGSAVLQTLEGGIEIRAEMLRLGGARVTGAVRSTDSPGGELAFMFDSDQSFLCETWRCLEETLRVFPARGR